MKKYISLSLTGYLGLLALASSALALEEAETQPLLIIQPNIVGGSETTNSYPWMAALVFSDTESAFAGHFCGGSLIHPQWVLTAGHCVFDQKPEDVDVVLGAHDLTDTNGTERIGVDEIILHPDYLNTVTDSDVALLRLKRPAGSQFEPIPIIDDTVLDQPGVVARALGWGKTASAGSKPEELHEVDLPIVSLATANATSAHSGNLTTNMLPAGYAEGGKDTCQGDSGGPLIVPSPRGWPRDSSGPDGNKWVLAGLTSFGIGCGNADSYGIYARVETFRRFILSHIYSDYIKWETEQGIAGERNDFDLDGVANFAEFAFCSDPLLTTGPSADFVLYDDGGPAPLQAIEFKTPLEPSEVLYTLRQSASLTNWTWYNIESNIVSQTVLSNGVQVVAATPVPATADAGYVSVVAEPTTNLVACIRPLSYPGGAMGTLSTLDAQHPVQTQRFMKLYRLSGLVTGETVDITGRSSAFDVRLELINEGTGAVLVDATSDAAGGTAGQDEIIHLVPASGVSYLLRVSSENNGGTGDYTVGTFNPIEYALLPALNVPATNSGSLAVSDPLDSLWPSRTYYSDDFRLIPGTTNAVFIQADSSAFEPAIEILNAETDVLLYEEVAINGTTLLTFAPIPGVSYIVRVTSLSAADTGAYTLETYAAGDSSTITVPSTITGELTTSDDPDTYVGDYKDDYALAGVLPGDWVTIYMQSETLDSFVYVAEDQTIYGDDFGYDQSIAEGAMMVFQMPASGSYTIRATTEYGAPTGSYSISASKLAVSTPGMETGSLESSDRVDLNRPGTYINDYVLTGYSTGQSLTVTVSSSEFDTSLEVRDAYSYGDLVAANDDIATGSDTNSSVTFTTVNSAVYLIRVTSHSAGETGNYTLNVSVN